MCGLWMLSFSQAVLEELPWREPQIDGREEKGANTELTKGCLLAFQAPYWPTLVLQGSEVVVKRSKVP